MGSNTVVSKKDITKLGLRSSLLQSSFNYERMQAGGFGWAMIPLLKKIYHDDHDGLKSAMKDNLEFINTHPNLVGFLMGLLISMEEKKENRETIKGIKVALFGPLGGIGDAIFGLHCCPLWLVYARLLPAKEIYLAQLYSFSYIWPFLRSELAGRILVIHSALELSIK